MNIENIPLVGKYLKQITTYELEMKNVYKRQDNILDKLSKCKCDRSAKIFLINHINYVKKLNERYYTQKYYAYFDIAYENMKCRNELYNCFDDLQDEHLCKAISEINFDNFFPKSINK